MSNSPELHGKAWQQRLTTEGSRLAALQAEELEKSLEIAPDDPAARMMLLGFYWGQRDHNACVDEVDVDIERNRYRHVLWLVQNCPELPISWDWMCGFLWSVGPQLIDAMKREWLNQIEKHPSHAQIIRNALTFIREHCEEPDLMERLYRSLEPDQ